MGRKTTRKTRAYKGRFFTRERVYVCNDMMDGQMFPVFQKPGMRRAKCKPTSEIQKKLNRKRSIEHFKRLIYANFTEKDLVLHLDYSQSNLPETYEDSKRLVANFIDRLKRKYKKAGLELRYVTVNEYGARKGRIHHHIFLTGGLDRDEIEKTWGLGYANTRRLQYDEDDGLKGIVLYLSKQRNGYKRWNQSRNLVQPQAAEFDGKTSVEEMKEIAELIEEKRAHEYFEKIYPEFRLIEARYTKNSVNGQIYIEFEMRRRA